MIVFQFGFWNQANYIGGSGVCLIRAYCSFCPQGTQIQSHYEQLCFYETLLFAVTMHVFILYVSSVYYVLLLILCTYDL